MVQVPVPVPVPEMMEAGIHCVGSSLHKCTRERYQISARRTTYKPAFPSRRDMFWKLFDGGRNVAFLYSTLLTLKSANAYYQDRIPNPYAEMYHVLLTVLLLPQGVAI